MLSSQERDQIWQIVTNLYATTKKIPFVQTLLAHPVYGQAFAAFEPSKREAVQTLIHERILDFLGRLTTKGGQLFGRLLEIDPDKFRTFRELNAEEKLTETQEFQVLGRWMEEQLFKLEGILTAQMLKKAQGLDKTVSAFYEIAYAVFPYLGKVEAEE